MTTQVRATDLLIAPPGMPDLRFRNSVLFLTHHRDQGSFALCVNKSTAWTLPEVLEGTDLRPDILPNIPVYWGGPVSPQSLWMLHSSDWVCEGTVMLSTAWAMTSSEKMFYHMADRDLPRQFRIVMGYCSWAPGQLEGELEGHRPWHREQSWLVAHDIGPEWLLEQDSEDLWASATTLCSHQAVDSWL